MEKEKSIYDLELHESTEVRIKSQSGSLVSYEVSRVPGGFIYCNCYSKISVFVPYNEDLKEKAPTKVRGSLL